MRGSEPTIRRLAQVSAIRIIPNEAFVETLVVNGVQHTFGVVGSVCMESLSMPVRGLDNYENRV